LKATKENILKIKNVFQAVKDFRPIRFIMDVDNY
jgi:primosomal protein N' (replication factor Y)